MLEKSRLTPSKLGMASARLATILEAVDDLIADDKEASKEREEKRREEQAVFEGFSRLDCLRVIRLANDQRIRMFANRFPRINGGLYRRLRAHKDRRYEAPE